MSFRRVWKASAMANLLQPLLYLLAIGVGIGSLIDDPNAAVTADAAGRDAIDDVGYLAYVGPAMLAATGMMTAGNKSLWDVLYHFKWGFTFPAQHTTPLGPGDITNGFALWHVTQITMSVAGVAVVLCGFDDTRTLALLPAVLFGVLTGMAVALPITAYSSTREDGTGLVGILRFVVIPMFLFGGVFYPISQLPWLLERVAWVTPLWHGVELCRDTVTGSLDAVDALGHVAVLVAYATAGWVLCRITFARRLRS